MKKIFYALMFIVLNVNAQRQISMGNIAGANVAVVNTTPQLSNLRITDTNKNRILFDADLDITGMTSANFKLGDGLGKTITSVTIDGDGLGGYFTISSAFTYWDFSNNLRLTADNVIYAFYLTYVDNQISEPSAATLKYVTTHASASDANGGTNQTTDAWATIGKAFASSVSGTTVYVQAGVPTGSIIDLGGKNGTATAPRKIIGYKTTPGDLDGVVYYTYGDGALSGVDAPLLDGGDRTSGVGIDFNNCKYWIIKNLQIQNYLNGVKTSGGSGSSFNVWDNLVIDKIGNQNSSTSAYGMILNSSSAGSNNKVSNTTIMNSSSGNIRIFESYNLIDNVTSICDEEVGTNGVTDYYISLYNNSNSTVINSYVERVGDLTQHTGHGIGTKNGVCEYNLFENSTVKNINFGVYFRHSGSKNNVVNNITFLKGLGLSGGLTFRDAASNNVAFNCTMTDLDRGLQFWDQDTEQGEQPGGFDNLVFNSIWSNCVTNIITTVSGGKVGSDANTGNELINCTFYGATNHIVADSKLTFDNTNKIINAIFDTNVNNSIANNAFVYEYSDFYNGFVAPSGTGNISVDPLFLDFIDFIPSNNLIVTAPKVSGINYSKSKKERKITTSMGAERSTTE